MNSRVRSWLKMSASDSKEHLQRVGVLSRVPPLLQQFGVTPRDVLADAGLTESALDDPHGAIPLTAAGRLLQLCTERTGCEHFGIEIAHSIQAEAFGALGQVMRNAPTLGTALRDFAANQHRNAHGTVVYLLTIEERAIFGHAVYHADLAGHNILCDVVATIAFNLVRELSQPGPTPVAEIWFAKAEPPI